MYEEEYDDVNYALNMVSSPISDEEMDELQDQCRRRINARCGGLLEVKGSSVQFLHQTVRDFLLTSEMSDFLSVKANAGFSVDLSTLRAFVARQKRIPHSATDAQGSTPLVVLDESLQYASDALEDSPMLVTELLDDLESLFQLLPGGEILPELKLIGESDADYFNSNTNFYCNSSDFLFRNELPRVGVSYL
ncbi:hypothetical protein ETB97_006990 [Aspergillus alliaceus]|uniref:DUF7791 domain-containing protein n=1 Tax=Petromyces alliaceus TaxID=209559 RepID=A0A8H5ZWT3_PETAA|nr:hypothetical protein ETB97_006990 [Aspergillus burnettii]